MEALNPANPRPEFRAKIGRIAIENAPMCRGKVSQRTQDEQLAGPVRPQVIQFEYFARKLFEIKILKRTIR
jgi:hypothetical protein